MKNKKCEIISDLLPSYVEQLTSKESNEMIEEHLRTCKLCKGKINNMSSELKIEEINQKELDYLKKYHKERNKSILLGVLISIFLILIWYLGTVFYRFYILHTLNLQYQDVGKKNNIYVEIMEADLANTIDNVFTTKYWYKDGIVKQAFEFEGDNQSDAASIIYFQDLNNQIVYSVNLKDKSITSQEFSPLMSQNILSSVMRIGYSFSSSYDLIKESFDLCSSRIYQNKQLYGKEYYVCDYGNEIEIFDKNSKLLQYRLYYWRDRIHLEAYKYEFGSVTEEDVAIPNL